jgi:hypothetical protein
MPGENVWIRRRKRFLTLRVHGSGAMLFGSQIAENYILGGDLLQRLADHCHAKPSRYKGERTGGTVRFLDDSWLALGDALARRQLDIDAALEEWEPRQIDLGRRLEAQGIMLGNRSQFSD